MLNSRLDPSMLSMQDLRGTEFTADNSHHLPVETVRANMSSSMPQPLRPIQGTDTVQKQQEQALQTANLLCRSSLNQGPRLRSQVKSQKEGQQIVLDQGKIEVEH
ncbi:hypothetical protein BGZ91_002232 [Linnemannia elongata]|nr:hypothetical protein BGZ91_002232 [Linnemannia elongata]